MKRRLLQPSITQPDTSYVTIRKNKRGGLRIYWIRGGKTVRLSSGPEHVLQADRLNKEYQAGQKVSHIEDGTVGWAVSSYRQSDAYKALAPSSRSLYGNYIFDSPIIPGYISTYGADKTNAHKEIAMSNQATGNSAHQPREGFMAPTFRIFVRTAEGAEFQAFTWCRDEASGIARAWREGREFGHNVAAVWAEAI